MENFISQINKASKKLQKEVIKKTSLGLDRTIPQANPVDDSIETVNKYYRDAEREEFKTETDKQTDTTKPSHKKAA